MPTRTSAANQITGTLVKPRKNFRTIFPSTVGDPALLPLLEARHVTVDAATNATPWLLQLVIGILPWLLLIGFFLWMASAMRNQNGGLLGGFGRLKPKRYRGDQRAAVTFNDVAGADEAKAELQEEVDFLRHSKKYRDLGARIPKGILLVGAPGTGKTLLDHTTVIMADFEEAQDKVRMGAAHQPLADPLERHVIAYHEAGHAVVAWLNPQADPFHKVTIVPHGQALGHTQQVPGEEHHNLSLSYLKAKLAVALAGRAAEEIVFDEVTTGAEQDLVEATSLARRMVTRWAWASWARWLSRPTRRSRFWDMRSRKAATIAKKPPPGSIATSCACSTMRDRKCNEA
ncbi:MAG TPA: hypothetical protein VNF68_00115 [Candidatus Baltobacteraceae bacterium]|nr:hypothetical protein [Candidatus Baltobacteraceae bacterium]